MQNRIYEILLEEGIELPMRKEDFNLAESLEESLEFISAMVAIEDNLGIEIPDEIFNYESLVSFKGFCELLEEQVNKSE